MDDVDVKIAAMEKELAELTGTIDALGTRLARGENSVRAELNPAVRRHVELTRELRDLRTASGRLEHHPPPMYGPPPVRFTMRTTQETPSSFWRRLFRRK
jgi:hypothetical protein